MPIVHNKRAQIFGNHLMTLIPGVNEVDGKVWEEFRKSPAIKHYIAEGEIEEMELVAGKDNVAGSAPFDLTALNQKDAVGLVKATFDKALLERWAEAESRKGVLDALEKQMDALKLAPKDETDPEEDEGEEEA